MSMGLPGLCPAAPCSSDYLWNEMTTMNRMETFSPDELQAVALALKLEAAAFYMPPGEPFLASLDGGELFADWPLAPDTPATQRGLQLLRSVVANVPPAVLLPELRSDYTALFIGLEQVDAPPWESVYLSRDHLLFDEQTLAVRDSYARFGLQIPNIDREPDDHIGFELLFLSHLVQQAAQALENSDAAGAEYLLAAAGQFLAAHPQQWAQLFVERIDRYARTDYYRGFGYLLLGSLEALSTRLNDALPAGQLAAEAQA
jgi:putative dimethyl sulfoxide reductase chaperone